MTSDWHIGTGAGRSGDIDSLVVRDRQGLPYIPAKTLTGMWRDACETVAWGLDNGTAGVWSSWVEFLFGSQPALTEEKSAPEAPRPAAIQIRPAFLNEDLRSALQGKPALQAAVTFVKPGVRLDPESGCAREDFLRFEEMVRGGTTLVAACFHAEGLWEALDEAQASAAQALLFGATRLFERLGGKRRRGAGLCVATVCEADKEVSLNAYLSWLSKHPCPPAPPTMAKIASLSPVNLAPVELPPHDPWVKIPLTITAESPLIMASRTVGNIVETLDYIPGAHLLPLLCKRLDHELITEAIAQGRLLVTQATKIGDAQAPAAAGTLSWPVPFALFGRKLGGGLSAGQGVYNRLQEPEPADQQLKGERQGYIIPPAPEDKHLPTLLTVDTTLKTHNTIQDEVQRPTSKVGGVYSYQAIAPGTIFGAELRLPQALVTQLETKDPRWPQKLATPYALGRSKKDEYGRVSILVGKPVPCTHAFQSAATLTVWLLSDLLLRDERLRPTTDPAVLAKVLGDRLNVNLKLRESSSLASLLARSRRTESWQARWGLPRPSLIGWAAGSCFVFEGKADNLDDDALAQLAIEGLGDRRAEGFGQMAFNHPLLTQPTSTLRREEATLPPAFQPQLLSAQSDRKTQDYARIIEQAAWRTAIRQSILAKVKTATGRLAILGITDNQPGLSQLGALRSVINQLPVDADPANPQAIAPVLAWLAHLKAVPNRCEKWPANSLNMIQDLVTSPGSVWSHLLLDYPSLTLTAAGQTQLQQDLWAEALKTLVDGCIRARRRDTETRHTSGDDN